MNSVRVDVDGKQFTDFTSLDLSRDKENLTCSGSITLSWPGAEQFNATSPPLQEMKDGAKITIYLDGKKAGTGRIDKRSGSGSAERYQLQLTFRGLSSSLVDSSADHPSGQENKKKPADIAKKLAEGYESKIVDKSNDDRTLTRYILREGETVERAIRTATREFGLIATENEDGDVEIKKRDGDEGSGPALNVGEHFTEWSVSRDMSPRQSKVKAKGGKVSTDESYGKDAEELAGEAIDEAVKFKKELHVLVDGDQDKESLKKRAITEARRRAAEGLSVELTLPGFTDPNGDLWKIGKMHHVSIPIEGLNDDLQISAVKFSLTDDTLESQITLVPKEAFSSKEDSKTSAKDSTKAKGTKPAKNKAGETGGAGSGFENFNMSTIKPGGGG